LQSQSSKSVRFEQPHPTTSNQNGVVVVHLEQFTGSLHVVPTMMVMTTTNEETPKMSSHKHSYSDNGHHAQPPLASKRIREELAKEEDEEMTHENDRDSPDNDEDVEAEPAAEDTVALTTIQQKECLMASPAISSTQSTTTLLQHHPHAPSTNAGHSTSSLLGQEVEDLSQPSKQPSSSSSSSPSQSARQPPLPQQILIMAELEQQQQVPAKQQKVENPQESETQDITILATDDDFPSTAPVSTTAESESVRSKKPLPARVSLGGPSNPNTTTTGLVVSTSKRCTVAHPPPTARWGHTWTPIGNNRVLLYGGQTWDPQTNQPITLNDVYVYDLQQKMWCKPFSAGQSGKPRQWHTSTYLPSRQLLISFGGEAIQGTKTNTVNEFMVLDTEIMIWYPPAVSGDVPTARSGHTATVLGNRELVVFGGVRAGGSKWLNSVSVLNIEAWKWSTPRILGAAPPPRSYHSATPIQNDAKIVIFGGNNADQCFDTIHVLEKLHLEQQPQWKWSHPTATGTKPKPRTGHSATLLADGKTICIYGGWDPNEDGNNNDDDEEMMFDDCYLLDTEQWQWRIAPFCGKTKLVGHATVLDPNDDNVVVLGGRIPGDRFTGDLFQLQPTTQQQP
jgi:hypothetical protein